MTPAIAVIAKAPVPGASKTRLCPPCSPHEAAQLAAAALRDTLDALLAVPGDARRVLVLEGEPEPWAAPGLEIVRQRGDAFAARLAAVFEDVGGPTFLVGMDTPQITPALLAGGLRALERVDACLGPALDGGYWGIGLRAPDPAVFAGVPMSASRTGELQLARLGELGLTTALLAGLRDVDVIADARAVAAHAPATRFATVLDRLERSWRDGAAARRV